MAVNSIDKARKGILKCYVGSIPMLGACKVQALTSKASGSLPDRVLVAESHLN